METSSPPRAPWLKDACAFLLLLGTTRTELVSINFASRWWYRGTTRGFEVCWLDFLWVFLLAHEYRSRRPDSRVPLPAGVVVMLVFLAYNALNIAISEPRLFGLFELSKMLRALMIFLAVAWYVKSERELRVLVWALSLAVGYEWLATLHARIVLGHSRPEGTLAHPNSLSMYNLMAFPVLLAVALSDTHQRLRRVAAVASVLATMCVVLTVSRAGLVSLALLLCGVGVTCGSLRVTAKKLAVAGVLVLLGGALFLKLGPAFEARFREGTLEKEYGGKAYEGRGAYFHLVTLMAEDSFWGCGLNNWSYWVSNRYGQRINFHYLPYTGSDEAPPKRRIPAHSNIDAPQAPPAHSLYAITLGETGWPGVVLYGAVWLRWLGMAGSFLFKRTPAFVSRFGVGAFFGVAGAFAQSFSEWELRQTPLLFLLYILLGAVAAIHPVRPAARAAA